MRRILSSFPIGAWLGLVIIGLGLWARDIFGVVLGGILAVVTLIATDHAEREQEPPEPDGEATQDDRFKDL